MSRHRFFHKISLFTFFLSFILYFDPFFWSWWFYLVSSFSWIGYPPIVLLLHQNQNVLLNDTMIWSTMMMMFIWFILIAKTCFQCITSPPYNTRRIIGDILHHDPPTHRLRHLTDNDFPFSKYLVNVCVTIIQDIINPFRWHIHSHTVKRDPFISFCWYQWTT